MIPADLHNYFDGGIILSIVFSAGVLWQKVNRIDQDVKELLHWKRNGATGHYPIKGGSK